jgi:glycosyltransferase involved in cell wall biosynthesis
MRVLLYAPVDLNLIDGSAIWCASLAQTLCHDTGVHVDILLNGALKRDVITAAFADEPRIRLLDSWRPHDCPVLAAVGGKPGPRLTAEQAFERIGWLHADQPYDLLILRGGPICQLVAAAPPLASRSWFYVTQHGADFETIRAISHSNARIACQTPLLQEFLEGMLGADPERYVSLPPMVPRLLCDAPRLSRAGHKLCYVGKFESDYMIEELLAAFAELRRRFPEAELIVAGDKFHDPDRTGEFERRVTDALRDTPGVVWRGGLPRDAVGRLMAECDVGSCWRSAQYDSSVELSTKALEYAAAGLPVLLNPSRINRLVFGDDYPLYVDSPASFRDRVVAAFQDADVYRRAAEMAFETCARFTFAEVNRRLRPHLDACRAAPTRSAEPRRPWRVVFAGHDFKFCREIIDHFEARSDCVVRLDCWSGHTRHDESLSEELVRWADAIWCEWCLGSAVWYSARVRPAQRLVIRLHRQEVVTDYPEQVTWPNVDHLIFIAPAVQQAIVSRLGPGLVPEASLIYNTVTCDRFKCEKTEGSEFRLGMLGYCPKLKNPRLAVEILQRLLEQDERWELLLTGRSPQDYAWLWSNPEERKYYEQFEQFIAARGLERRVVRQDWTEHVSAWYAQVGFILSCSDLEGSHQVVAEGMAGGCIPVVRRWHGAREMYPNSLLFESAEEAAGLIVACADPQRRAALIDQGRREARQRFDTGVILPKLVALMLGMEASTPEREAAIGAETG